MAAAAAEEADDVLMLIAKPKSLCLCLHSHLNDSTPRELLLEVLPYEVVRVPFDAGIFVLPCIRYFHVRSEYDPDAPIYCNIPCTCLRLFSNSWQWYKIVA